MNSTLARRSRPSIKGILYDIKEGGVPPMGSSARSKSTSARDLTVVVKRAHRYDILNVIDTGYCRSNPECDAAEAAEPGTSVRADRGRGPLPS